MEIAGVYAVASRSSFDDARPLLRGGISPVAYAELSFVNLTTPDGRSTNYLVVI